MGNLLASLMEPGSMGREQWLIVGIVAFILIASVCFIYRLFMIFKDVGKSTYKPNIGLSRIKAHSKYETSSPKSE